MLGVNGNSACNFDIRWNQLVTLEVVFEESFDRHLKNYIGKLEMITWN